METIVTQVLRPTEIIYLFIAVMNVFNAYNDREYTVHDNRHRLEALLHAYLRLKDAMEHLQQSLYTFDRESQSLIQMHARTVTKNEETLQSLREAVLDAKFMNRVKRTEKVLKECEADSEKIMGFLSTQVVPVLREREQESQYDYVYEADNNVPPNPPRLTLDYSTVLTCEGQLKAAVLKEDGSRVVGVVALGMGGVGKTCALRGLAEEEDIKQRFPGGLYFIQVGKDATLSTVIHGVATAVERTGNPSLGERLKGETTLQELANRASIWFRHQTCLFLIDDIWLGQSINSSVLRVLVTMLSERSRLVYTTRSQQSVNVCSNVIEFSAKETYSQMARRMLMTHAEFDCKETLNERNEEAVRGILRICDGLPVAIGVVGETVRKENRRRLDDNADIWNVVYDRLRFRKESISDGFAEAYGSVRLVVDTSLDVLQSAHSDTDFDDMFSALCVLEKHQMVPIHMLRNLWGLPDLEKTKDIVEELDEVSLVRKLFDGQLVLLQLHDVILDIAIRKASEQYEVKRFWEVLIENYITQERSSREDTGGGQSSEDQVETSHEREKVECMRWHQKLCCFNVIGTVDTETDQQNDGPQLQTDGENKFWEWWNTEDDRYIHDNICRALRGAGYDKHLLWLVSKPQWIVSRLQKSGFYAVEQDLDAAKGVALCMNQIDKSLCKHLDMVRKAARMSCPHVANNRREAWFQIHGRLLWYATQCERTKQFVEEIDRCAPRPWAKASMGFLEQAGTAAAEKIECSGEPLTLRYDKSRVSFFFRKYNGRFVREQYSFISGETESHAYDLPEFGGKELRPIDSALCQDLNTVVMLVEGEQIVRWNLESMETSHWLANGIRCTALNPEENLVVCGLQDGRLQVRELEGGEHVGRPFVGHTDTVICVAWSGDGKRVASVSQDKTVLYGRVSCGCLDYAVRLWEVKSGKLVGQPLLGHTYPVKCVAWSIDGMYIASASSDRSVRVWEVERWECVQQPMVGDKNEGRCVAWSWDGRPVVFGSEDKTVQVWDLESWEPVGEPCVGHTQWVRCVAWSKDGRRVASGSWDKTVRVWDVESGEPVGQPMVGHKSGVRCVAWSWDGRRLVSGSEDETVRVWDVESGEPVGQPMVGHTGGMTCVAWSGDGRRVVSGSDDKTVRVWDVESGEAVGEPMTGHTRRLAWVGWRGDGRRVVSGSDDETVRVWNVESGQQVGSPIDVSGLQVALNDDGTRLLLYGKDKRRRELDIAGG